MNKNYELNLPDGYIEAFKIDALNKKFGIIFNLISFVVLLLVLFLASLFINPDELYNNEPHHVLIGLAVFMLTMVLYVVLHEIVHGIAYKALTKQKLTFGLSWSCAFCGVPNIYTYRRTSLIALLAPFITFSIILIPLTAFLYFINPLVFLGSSFILGLHLGGCSGDIYMSILLLTKFKEKDTLINDTGPKQTIYVREK